MVNILVNVGPRDSGLMFDMDRHVILWFGEISDILWNKSKKKKNCQILKKQENLQRSQLRNFYYIQLA